MKWLRRKHADADLGAETGDPLEEYASDGEALAHGYQLERKVRPIADQGNVNEIIGKFGGAKQLRNAVNQLQSLLYAASTP